MRKQLKKQSITPKATRPSGHIGPRRWIKYITRNVQLIKSFKHPERFLNSSRNPSP